jgi:hypothetical protein
MKFEDLILTIVGIIGTILYALGRITENELSLFQEAATQVLGGIIVLAAIGKSALNGTKNKEKDIDIIIRKLEDKLINEDKFIIDSPSEISHNGNITILKDKRGNEIHFMDGKYSGMIKKI